MEEEEDGGGWVVCVGLIRAAVVYLRADTSFFFCSDNAYLYGANNGCQEREGDVKKKKKERGTHGKGAYINKNNNRKPVIKKT